MQIFTDTIDVTAPLTVGLWNHQPLLGDRLAMTAFVRDLAATYPHWRIWVDVAKGDPWENNPHVAGVITPGVAAPEKFDVAWRVGPFAATQGSKTNGIHIMRAFAYGWTRKTGLPIRHGPVKADLHLSAPEKAYRPIAGPYWVVNADTNNMGAKRWHPDRWRALFRSLPQRHFVQVGLAKDAVVDYGDEPNVTSLLDATTERQLFALVARASGCISLVSSLMHVAAAFDVPCVVLAGGREPQTFEAYPGHQFLHRIGTIACARDLACWKNSIGACQDRVETEHGPVARCMTTIAAADVQRAVELYYEGGRLACDKSEATSQILAPAERTPVIRIVTNGRMFGGAERSCHTIAKLFHDRDWQVEIATRQPMCGPMAEAFAPIAVPTTNVSRPCDVLLWYASDQVFDAHLEEFAPLRQAAAAAQRKVMALTYKLGKVPDLDWCGGWDRYLFLCSQMRDAFLERSPLHHAAERTAVLAPPVDLEPFLAVEPSYELPIRVVRHSSQGDDKWPADTAALVESCRDVRFDFLPGPSWLGDYEHVTKRPFGSVDIAEFLAGASVFLYLLPDDYSDQGPRVIVEAMAAGLAVIADNRWGAADRVTPSTGWLLDDQDAAAETIGRLTPELLAAKGRAARRRAWEVFGPQRWVEAIIREQSVFSNGVVGRQ